MASSKKTDRICVVVLIVTLILTVLFMNGTYLGIEAVADEDAEGYEGTEHFTANDMNGNWDTSGASVIMLEGTDGTISGNGAYFYNGNLVITNGGYYVIEGELSDGSIIIDAYRSSKIWIMLNGAEITCSDDAGIRVEQADKVFLTLADGTENIITGGEEYSDEALESGVNAAIFSHDDLTINGNGSLTVTAGYKHGIVSKDTLVITGGNITVTAAQDGMNVNDSVAVTGADITINAGDDGIHCDGTMYIGGGSITVTECYEGLEAVTVEIADGVIEIEASDDGINANGGSSDGFGMQGMQGRGRNQMTETGENMPGGDSGEQKSSSEGINEQKSPFEGTDEQKLPSEGTDEQKLPSEGTDEQKLPSEGIDEQKTSDTDAENQTSQVLIYGGSIRIINPEGNDSDGIDSNGDIIISGGDVFICMNGSGGNNALDYGSENGGSLIINGGTVAAFGGSSMLEEVSENSEQCTFTYIFDGTVEAGTTIRLLDSDGNTVLEYEAPNTFGAATLSSPALVKGAEYKLQAGDDTEVDITLENTVTTLGNANMSMNGRGGMSGRIGGTMGGMMPGTGGDNGMAGGEPPEFGGMAGGEPPEFGGMTGGEPPEFGGMADGESSEFDGMTGGESSEFDETAGGEPPEFDETAAGEAAEDGGMALAEPPENSDMSDEEQSERYERSEGAFNENAQAAQRGSFGRNQMDNEKRSIRGKALNDSEDTDKADTRLQFSEIPADSWITFGISAIALAAIIFVIKHRK